jgi:predicted glutamine amidotransferase
MCRFFGFLGSAPAKVDWYLARAENSLLAQSRRDRTGNSHLDGWGIGYYAGDFPVVAWSASPAPTDGKFLIAAHAVRARAVIAHVRDASVGGASLVNTHPFTYGRWLFAHNGTVTPFEHVAPALTSEIPPALFSWRQGNTDSELVFYWLLARMMRAGMDLGQPCSDLPALRQILSAVVKELASACAQAGDNSEPSKLNFLLTDGSVLLATRWRHSLCWSSRKNSVLVASEAMDQERWHEVADGTLLTVDSRLQVTMQPM